MPDIKISNPIEMEMSILGAEDILPSFEVSIDISILSFSESIKYKGNSVWFECSKWDIFVQNIHLRNKDAVTLESMCEKFKIILFKKESSYYFSLSTKVKNSNRGECNFNTTQKIDSNVLSEIDEDFDQFPKWW